MSLFAASSFYLYGEFSVCTKEELKSMIEKNGGKVTARITTKTSYIVCSGHTRDILEKSKNFNLALLSESYIMDCVNAKKKLPVTNYVSPPDKKAAVHKKDCSNEDDGDIYDFVGTSDIHNNKENHVNKLKEKLKRISLSKNSNNKRENEDDDHNMIISSKKLKQATRRSESGGDEAESMPSLKDLVFYLYGQFSIPPNVLKDVILDNGGKIACAVDDSVTHFLFGGESVDVPEFQEAQRRKIHIVNEYFLRLLVKY